MPTWQRFVHSFFQCPQVTKKTLHLKTPSSSTLFFRGDKTECRGKVEKEGDFLQGEKGDPHHHGHLGCFCCHMDAIQRDGPDQHLLFDLHPKLPLDHRLLAVLHQQHHQPSLLRSLQRHLQKHLQAPAPVPVQEHPYGAMRPKTVTHVKIMG